MLCELFFVLLDVLFAPACVNQDEGRLVSVHPLIVHFEADTGRAIETLKLRFSNHKKEKYTAAPSKWGVAVSCEAEDL